MPAWLFAAILLLGLLKQEALAQTVPTKYATQLRSECDLLIQSAVRRPYGWGWDPALRSGDPRRPTSRPVSMEPLGTPAAATVLLWAGKLLDEPKFIDAATQAGRGICASQMGPGKIPAMPIFSTTAGGRDEPAVIPDRASTCAALGFMLILLDESPPPRDERVLRSTLRAAKWMQAQQTEIGGWPSSFPPGAGVREAVRVLRLDQSDYRDSCLAVLLAADVLQDKAIARSNEKMMSHLMLLHRDDPATASNGLWYSAYKLNGTPDPAAVGAPVGLDTLASRYAMQTLLAAYLLTGDKAHGMALDTAALTLGTLRHPDGTWDRYLETPESASTQPATAKPSEQGLPDLLAATTQLRKVGRQRYTDLLAANFTTRQQIAATLVGLSDDPLTLEMPVSSTEARAYIERHADWWQLLDGPLPETLPDRVRRLWVLLLRAKLERRIASETQVQ